MRRNIARIPAHPRLGVAQEQRFRAHRFGRGAVGLSGPYGSSIVIDARQTNPPPFDAADDTEPAIVDFVPPVCVRPLIIQLKPLHLDGAAHLPRIVPCSPMIARF
ncbi:MAG: hypothetical protein NVSMB26_23830 [Beijerinckiaceae bacterium]